LIPELTAEGLRKTTSSDYALRFVFGGVVAACTGLVAQKFGPIVGGLFLAFPAILPAGLTLVEAHDGRSEVVDDARGACLGSLGLAAFAVATWRASGALPAAVLAIATVAWLVASVGAWLAVFGRKPDGRAEEARHARS